MVHLSLSMSSGRLGLSRKLRHATFDIRLDERLLLIVPRLIRADHFRP